MGMYTELNFGARLISNLPCEVGDAIAALSNGLEVADKPDHPFFKTCRYDRIMTGRSYYFLANVTPMPVFQYDSIANCYVLIFRANIKNYENEIELFLDWIEPYIDRGCGANDYYAVTCYECGDPVIYYLHGDKDETYLEE